MGAAGSSKRHRLRTTAWKTVDGDEILPGSGSDDDRGQLAECLAFISDMALTGDAEAAPRVDPSNVGLVPAGPYLQQLAGAGQDDAEDATATTAAEPVDVSVVDAVDDEMVPEPSDSSRGGGLSTSSGSGGRARWLRHRLRRLRLQRQRSAPGRPIMHSAASVDDSVSSHIQMLNSLDSQEDDSEDWAEMRSWLVWCLRDKLGDADVLHTATATGLHGHSPHSSSSRRSDSTTSRGAGAGLRQLVRQQAVHERSPHIGVVDCSLGVGPTQGSAVAGGGSRVVLRCRSAETRHEVSLDDEHLVAASVSGERLQVAGGGASCSGQSSFESYGSTG